MCEYLRIKTLKRGEVAAALLSASLFIMQFFLPSFFFWLGLCWLLPLLCVDRKNEVGFGVGFLWGVTVFSFHLCWLAYILFFKSLSPCRIIVYLFTVIYYSFISGLFFLIKQKIAHHITVGFAWVVSLLLFFMYIVMCSLFFLGNFWDGYPFIHPLLPFTSYHNLLLPINVVGAWGYVFLLLLGNVLLLKYNRFIFLFIFVILGCAFLDSGNILDDASISYISARQCQRYKNSSELFYNLSELIDHTFLENQSCNLLVFPESCFPYNLHDWKPYLSAWSSLNEDCSIIIGGHYCKNNKNFNTLYHIKNGMIIEMYHKNHLMPFTERIPIFFGSIPFFKDMFVSKRSDTFNYFDLQNDDLFFINNKKIQVYICSELYFNSKVVNKNCDALLVVANDSWFGLPYVRHLAYLLAQLFAFIHKKELIYAAHYKFDVIKKEIV